MNEDLEALPTLLAPVARAMQQSVTARHAGETAVERISAQQQSRVREIEQETSFATFSKDDVVLDSSVTIPELDQHGLNPQLSSDPLPTKSQEPMLTAALHQVESSSYVNPSTSLRSVAQEIIDRPLPALRIHNNALADTLTRLHRADAMTFGQHIAFRHGLFGERTVEQVALFVHEATHAADHKNLPSDPHTERVALHNESLAMTLLSPPQLASAESAPAIRQAASIPSPAGGAAAPPAASHRGASADSRPKVHFAETGRSPVRPEPAPPTTALDLDYIKREVYQHIVARLRSDFERGE